MKLSRRYANKVKYDDNTIVWITPIPGDLWMCEKYLYMDGNPEGYKWEYIPHVGRYRTNAELQDWFLTDSRYSKGFIAL